MSSAEAWPERVPLNGEVDFTMMYVAHDAFTRDLQRLCRASERGEALSPRTLRTWALLKKQLHVHHHVEDTALWPRLRAAVAAASELATLEAMELEHAQIDPEIEMVDAAIAAGRPPRRRRVPALGTGRGRGQYAAPRPRLVAAAGARPLPPRVGTAIRRAHVGPLTAEGRQGEDRAGLAAALRKLAGRLRRRVRLTIVRPRGSSARGPGRRRDRDAGLGIPVPEKLEVPRDSSA